MEGESQYQDPRTKSLHYKIKAVSKENAGSKANNLSDLDMKTFWSTNTNAKEWLIVEL
jgi:hypothetical protein